MLKRFLKAKKGKELIEIIVLFPVTLFLIMFSLVQLLSFIFSSQVQDKSVTYTRTMITQRTLYNAIMELEEEMASDENYTITCIKITSKCTSSDCSSYKPSVAELDFASSSSETTYFKSLYKAGSSGEYSFNYAITEDFANEFKRADELWVRGNYIEITTMRATAKVINSISKISIYDASEKKNVTLNYGVSGYVYATTTNIIIY